MKTKFRTIIKNITSGFNIILKQRIGEKMFRIPILGNLGFQNMKREEPWMVTLLKLIFKIEDRKFIDVGVNVGQTLLKVKAIDVDRCYIGFEPNPSCIHYANKLVKINKFSNVTLLPFGVSVKTGLAELQFYHNSSGDTSASIIKEFRNNQVVHKDWIPIISVEDIIDKVDISNVGVLKIDVEGSELEVIQSFRQSIIRDKPIIIIEILPVYNKHENQDRYRRQSEIQDFLKNENYTVFRIIKKNGQLENLEKIAKIEIHEDLNSCDYLCVHKSKLEQLMAISKIAIPISR